MPHLEKPNLRSSLPLQLLLIFTLSAVVMFLFRDVRAPLDGSWYAQAVKRLAAGDLEDVFRWSHALHVPVLLAGYRLVGAVVQVEVLAYYQALDILLGAGGLCLVHLLVRRSTRRTADAVLAVLLVMFSWVYWIESVTADEKMLGYFFVLVYLNLLDRFLGPAARNDGRPGTVRAVLLGCVLALSILLHASAVLVVPVSIFMILRNRAFRFGMWAALVSAGLTVGAYALILNLLGVSGLDEAAAYFSSGVSRYSVAATGLSGMAWGRSVVQGLTKLLWAVFSEDGPGKGMFLAGMNALFLAGMSWVMWRTRGDQALRGYIVLFVTAGLFGMTYAPDSPDSYFLMLVPLAVFFSKALSLEKFRYPAIVFVAVLIVGNGTRYLEFSGFRDEGVDRGYQAAIGQGLSAGDALVILDSDMGLKAGTQAVMPLHAYFNPDLEHVPGSEFLADPAADRFRALAREGRLFIEGLCFEEYDNRRLSDVRNTDSYRELARIYDLEPVIRFGDYSTLYHRAYKHVFRIRIKSSP